MLELDGIAWLFLLFGATMAAAGGRLVMSSRLPYMAKLPGDILMTEGNVSLLSSLTTMLKVSARLTFVVSLLIRLLR